MKPRVVVVMPAYNAERTLERTYRDIPAGSVDEVILVDDGSHDRTVELAARLGLHVICHPQNRGYGGNQKTCYRAALASNADVIVMVHPDYQYDPRVIPFAVGFIAAGICDVVIGSRIRSRKETLDGGMPLYKYLSNRVLTTIENVVLGQNLGDFHSGFRVYRREVLETINFERNSDGFVCDTELLAQAIERGYRVGDIPIPTRYEEDSSSIDFWSSVRYGFGTLLVLGKFLAHRGGLHVDLFAARKSTVQEEIPRRL